MNELSHPLFEKETPTFWTQRSDNQSYQRAYQLLAEKIPRGYFGRIADIACGTGRLTAHVYRRLKKGAIIGTDSSDEMLCLAEDYLNRCRIPVQKYVRFSEIDLQRPGVHLLNDNIVCSTLPHSLFHTTFFIFPELGDGYPYHPEDGNIINRALAQKFIEASRMDDPEFLSGFLTTMKADHHLSRITCPGGRIIQTHYGEAEQKTRSSHNWETLQWYKEKASFLGLKLAEWLFREEDEIWRDTITYITGQIRQGYMKGYWTTVMNKERAPDRI